MMLWLLHFGLVSLIGRLSMKEENSLGCMRWRSVLESLPPPDDADRQIMGINVQIDNLRQVCSTRGFGALVEF